MQTHVKKSVSSVTEEKKLPVSTSGSSNQWSTISTASNFQAMADSSTQTAQLRALQAQANTSPLIMTAVQRRGQQIAGAERKDIDVGEVLQGRFITEERQGTENEGLLSDKEKIAQRTENEAEDAFQVKAPQDDAGLPEGLKVGIESLSGMSMHHVKVHYNSDKPAQLNAHAYAQGTDIHVAPGQEQHLPHEAWHIVQQAQGRVVPTAQTKGGAAVNEDNGLEREADVMGGRAVQMQYINRNRPSTNVGIAQNKRSGSSAGNGFAGQVVLQKKTGNIPTAQQLEQRAGRGVTITSKTHTYEDVLDAVADYHSNATTPDNDYGKQLYQLAQITHRIGLWEAKYGLTTQAIVNRRIIGISKEDKRRQVLNSVNSQLPAEDQAVKQQGLMQANGDHLQDRGRLLQYVQDGLQQQTDRTLQNSCDWILNAHKTVLYAATPTGDSYMRLRSAGKDPAVDEAFFPEGVMGAAGDVMGAAVSYNANDFTDNANVTLTKTKRTGGWNDTGSPGLVVVVRPAKKSRDQVWETLRHEVQHDSDKHKGREALAGIRRAGEDFDATGVDYAHIETMNSRAILASFPNEQSARLGMKNARAFLKAAKAELGLSKYKTEYRAYSYQEGVAGGAYTALDNTVQNQNYMGEMFSARQLGIFKHIYGGYAYAKKGWDENQILADGVTTFRQAVASYWDPDSQGFNKYNSARVDDFYRALDQVGTKMARTGLEIGQGLDAAPVAGPVVDHNDAQVQHVLLQIASLNHDDAQYILNESPDMMAKINSHLAGQALTDVLTQLGLR